jgi:hypothetical protein
VQLPCYPLLSSTALYYLYYLYYPHYLYHLYYLYYLYHRKLPLLLPPT